ncbi:MAG TPA: glycosyltransferase family 39 protein [Planctomycetaceae bacterium]|nr:glycosyltransferase family 39 protein [Planctomycetaceae bacterium]
MKSFRSGVGMSLHRYFMLLTVITLLAWGLRLGMTAWFVGLTAPPDPRDGLDQLDYDLFAYRMSIGEGYTLDDGTPSARRAPGTSLLLLPVYLLCGRCYLAAHLWMTALSAATCAVGAELVRRTWGFSVALGTAVALAVHPGLTYYAMFLWSEAPFTFFAALGTWLTVRSLEASPHRNRWSLAAGLTWGFAILLRPQVVLMGPIAIVIWWWSADRRRSLFVPILVQLVVACAVTLPWVARNAIVMHMPCLATLVGGHTFWGAHNPVTFTNPQVRGDWVGLSHMDSPSRQWPAGELEQEAAAWKYAWEDIRAHLPLLPQLMVAKVWRLLSPFENTPNRMLFWAYAGAWMLTLPGLVFGCRELLKREPLLAGTIAVQLTATLACVILFYGGGRFRHVHEPLLVAVSAIGVQRMFRHATIPARLCVPTTNPTLISTT